MAVQIGIYVKEFTPQFHIGYIFQFQQFALFVRPNDNILILLRLVYLPS